MLLMRRQELWQQAAATTDTFAALVAELRDLIRQQQDVLAERELAQAEREQALDERLERLAGREAALAERERELKTTVEEFTHQQVEMRELLRQVQIDRSMLKARSLEVSEREKALSPREEQLVQLESDLQQRETDLAGREQGLTERERALQFGLAMIKRQARLPRPGGGEVAVRSNVGAVRILDEEEDAVTVPALSPPDAAESPAAEPEEPVTARVIGPGGETQVVQARVRWDDSRHRR